MLNASQLMGGMGAPASSKSPGDGGGVRPHPGAAASDRAANNAFAQAPQEAVDSLPESLRSIPKEEEGDAQSIGHEDFLRLMMVQLKNQDPTKPQDTEQMMSQIAQFTTASGIERLATDFRDFFEHMRSDQSLRAAQLVGREVMTESGQAHLAAEGEVEALLQLDRSVPNLTVQVENAAGERVHRAQLGQREQGEHAFVWDGTNDDGERLPAGSYQLRAYVEDGDERRAVETLIGAPVTSVTMGKGGGPPQLSVVGVGELSLSDVKRIR